MQTATYPTATYIERRGRLETYFDRTAAQTWARLTSDAPVSGIRKTVRAGRDEVRATLLSWMPFDLAGKRLLDAGCGTGALAVEAARRGAEVVAIDLAGTLVNLAGERAPRDLRGSIDFRVGDMTDPSLGRFDYVVGMDSLIHYRAADMADVVARLAANATGSVLFTFAPATPMLSTMHAVGRIFPRGDRAPFIEPIGVKDIARRLAALLPGWHQARTHRVATGFYTSQALELVRAEVSQ
jgi:magnesium-protoporphyrin O-methyltransferase